MGAMASQITSPTIAYSSVYSGADQRKHQSKRHVTGFCAGNSPVTGEFPTQMASNAENVSIWWRHHVLASVGSIWRHLITVVYAFFKSYTSLVKPEGGVLFLYIWTDFWLWLTATDEHSIRPSMENAYIPMNYYHTRIKRKRNTCTYTHIHIPLKIRYVHAFLLIQNGEAVVLACVRFSSQVLLEWPHPCFE